jgi:quercetin dioxygenase-like cupin family protein
MREEPEDRHRTSDSGESHSPKHGGRAMAAPVLRFDLQRELGPLRQQPSYQKGNPSGRTLVKEPDLRIMLMAIRAGGRLQKHSASGPISIQAIEGPLRVLLPGESIELTTGELLVVETGIRHEIVAMEDSAFLLTIGRTTYQQVSDLHEPGG